MRGAARPCSGYAVADRNGDPYQDSNGQPNRDGRIFAYSDGNDHSKPDNHADAGNGHSDGYRHGPANVYADPNNCSNFDKLSYQHADAGGAGWGDTADFDADRNAFVEGGLLDWVFSGEGGEGSGAVMPTTIDPAWLSLLVQVPLVGLFMWFVIYWQRNQQASISRNHQEWRDWLTHREQEVQDREDRRQAALMEQLNAWRVANHTQSAELVAALSKAEQQLNYLTTLTLMTYTAVSRVPLPDEVARGLKQQSGD